MHVRLPLAFKTYNLRKEKKRFVYILALNLPILQLRLEL